MAAKALDIHPAALAEIKSAVLWYLDRSESAAEKLVELDHAINLIVGAPQRWPSAEHGSRKFALSRFPYAVFYKEMPATIRILAVAHGHRRPGYGEGRL